MGQTVSEILRLFRISSFYGTPSGDGEAESPVHRTSVPGKGVSATTIRRKIKLAQKWCWLQWNAATGGILEELLILPASAIQSCHLIRSGLDCQIPLSEAAWTSVGETGSKVRIARDTDISTHGRFRRIR
jgi:hypothetical protein